jgi:hypothetical protein
MTDQDHDLPAGANGDQGIDDQPPQPPQISEIQYCTQAIVHQLEKIYAKKTDEVENSRNHSERNRIRQENEKTQKEVVKWTHKISKYDGSTVSNTRNWLLEMDLVHKHFGNELIVHTLDVATTVAQHSLRKEIFRIQEENPQALWKEVREQLQLRFLSINENEALRRELEKLKQTSTETVANFCRNFRDVAEQAYPPINRNDDQNRIILRSFLQNLKSNELAKRINGEGRPKTLEKAIRFVGQYEEDADRFRRLNRNEEPMDINMVAAKDHKNRSIDCIRKWRS